MKKNFLLALVAVFGLTLHAYPLKVASSETEAILPSFGISLANSLNLESSPSVLVSPQPGTVSSLKSFSVSFTNATSVEKGNLTYGNAPYVISMAEGASKIYCFSVNCEGNVLNVATSKEITEEGDYSLHLPAGFYKIDGAVSEEELVFNYTIKEGSTTDLIKDAPKGEKVECQTDFLSWFPTPNGIWGMPLMGKPTHYILGEDGNLYLYNPIITDPFGNKFIESYIKAEKSDNRYIAHFPQPIYVDSQSGKTIYLNYAKKESGQTYVTVEQNQNYMEFVVDEDKNCKALLPVEQDGTYALCAMDETGGWQYFGNVRMDYNYFYYTTTPLPKNAIIEDWKMEFSVDSTKQSLDVNVVIDGNDMWLQGFSTYCENWAHAVINDTTVVFDPYFGVAESIGQYLFLFNSLKDDKTSSKVYPLEFTFDRENRKLTDNEIMVVNPNDWFYYVVEKFHTPVICPTTDDLTTKVPKAPSTFDAFMLLNKDSGKYTVSVRLSSENVNDEPLSTKRLYYELVKQNGSIYEFTPEQYPALSEPMSLIPYSFLQSGVISGINNARNFFAVLPGDTDFGCRMVYRDETGTYKSNILWAVAGEDQSGVDNIASESNVTATEWYDLNGRKVSALSKGVYICKKILSNGSTEITKVIR